MQDYAEQHNLGEVWLSPCDVYLNNELDVVQPDILFVKKGQEHIIHTKGIVGIPIWL